jgi:hypothetical protein
MLRRIQELVSAQPVEEEPQERVRITPWTPIAHCRCTALFPLRTRPTRLSAMANVATTQYQEAQDAQIPFPQGHRPQVQEEP